MRYARFVLLSLVALAAVLVFAWQGQEHTVVAQQNIDDISIDMDPVHAEDAALGQCDGVIDDDGDTTVDDGCPGIPTRFTSLDGSNGILAGTPLVNADRNADGIPDAEGSPIKVCGNPPGPYTGNGTDDDGDTAVDDGCPGGPAVLVPPAASVKAENDPTANCAGGTPQCGTDAACFNNVNDDPADDAVAAVNDGCPATPEMGLCGNGIDDDPIKPVFGALKYDGVADDGCPVLSPLSQCIEMVLNGVQDADEDFDDFALIDITVGQVGGVGIPPERAMTAWQYSLNWTPKIVDVYVGAGVGEGIDFLIGAAGAATPFTNIWGWDPLAGYYTHWVADGGPADSGPGVLQRLLITATGPGLVDLTLSDITIQDVGAVTYDIQEIYSAELAVSQDGPDVGTTIGDSAGELFSCDDVDGDSDGDGVADTTEIACGSNPNNINSVPERLDTVSIDDDGNDGADEALPPGSEGYDCDGDGWTGEKEEMIFNVSGTANDQDPCGGDGWPADLFPNNILNIGDMNTFTTPPGPDDGHGTFNYFGHSVPDVDINGPPDDSRPNAERWNLDQQGAGAAWIDIGDLNAINPGVNASTSWPPMFGGESAYFINGGECPWPP